MNYEVFFLHFTKNISNVQEHMKKKQNFLSVKLFKFMSF